MILCYKMETYRLYQAGFLVADIANVFCFSIDYLYKLWEKFQTERTTALVDKRWETATT